MQCSPVRRGAWSVCHHAAAGSFSLSPPCRVVCFVFRSERRHATSADHVCLRTHDQRASARGNCLHTTTCRTVPREAPYTMTLTGCVMAGGRITLMLSKELSSASVPAATTRGAIRLAEAW